MVPGALAALGDLAGSLGWLGPVGSLGLLAACAAMSVNRAGVFGVVVTTGAVALEVGRAVDPAGAVPDPVGAAGLGAVLVGAPPVAPWRLDAGLVAAGLDGVAVTVGAAWPVG